MRMLIGIGVVAVLVVGGVLFYLDRIVGGAIETAGEQALGVPTHVGLVTLRPFVGRFGLTSLRVANPPGFETPHFLELGRVRIDVGVAGLRADPVIIERVELIDLDVNLERGQGGTNYGTILGSGGGGDDATGDEAASVVIRELVIRDLHAQVRLTPGGDTTAIDVNVPEIVMRDLGEKDGGLSRTEMMQLITRAVLSAVANKSGELPLALARDITSQVGRELQRQLGGASGAEAQRAIEDATRDVLRGIGGLLGGGEPE